MADGMPGDEAKDDGLDGAGPKVVPLPPRDELAGAGDAFRRNLDTLIANAATVARYRRALFVAHVEAGFSEAQALELCVK